jgi:hypothetical protein
LWACCGRVDADLDGEVGLGAELDERVPESEVPFWPDLEVGLGPDAAPEAPLEEERFLLRSGSASRSFCPSVSRGVSGDSDGEPSLAASSGCGTAPG